MSTPPLLVIDSDVELRRIPFSMMVDALAEGHRLGYNNLGRFHASVPRPTRPDAEVLVWIGSQAGGGSGLKFVTVSPDNASFCPDEPDAIHAAFLLADETNGRIKCCIVGNSFTRYKTAADSALATRFLAPKHPKRLLIIGAGAQASVHLPCMCAEFPTLEYVEIWDRNDARVRQLIDQAQIGPSIKARVADHLERSVRAADIIICVTPSTRPVFDGEWLKPGSHVDLVGSFTPDMREADDTAVQRASVFVDHLGLVLEHCGDLTQPLATGVIDETHIRGDLFSLCRGEATGRRSEQEITLFKNGGGGHLDLMFAEWLSKKSDPANR